MQGRQDEAKENLNSSYGLPCNLTIARNDNFCVILSFHRKRRIQKRNNRI
ncbi:hypothetical protein HFN_0262 [Helicobacter fennelliae MRY12-0050]|uniref:Uncharacterized protein n=1 Tax=Helicobacter fennelliae MRY12-0050 TaxID=1325130 RepID=T1D1M4_9HELI|nr:hypothetical protein HFN_0262 [Helicobacter fennelliae MRY12-0050]